MADAYWRYAADPRQQPPPPAGPHPGAVGGAPPAASHMVGAAGGQQPMKRPRPTEFSDVPGAPDMTGYYPHDEERAGQLTLFIELQQIQSYGAGPTGEPIRPTVGGNAGYPVDDRPMMAARGMDSRNIGYRGAMPEPPLPPDASNTLFIEDIFRPFVGFREVRLVNKEPKHPGGDPICLCFVDFADAAQAAIALEALQGEIDELNYADSF
ncbi:hypothetical protein PR202_gb18138 [Eleusine coracana subsp. coracana]|uniref:RRM domain-containing protein n=1 Tax=Eleusine coracana subsp. coracana TaxID=191504 RepID=A0AAV5F4V9_ELECO|nr:hypothetical protein PR202_gb18138 [Eleusine coracana subsp. coracana]